MALLVGVTLLGCASAPMTQAVVTKPQQPVDQLGGAVVTIVAHRPSAQKYRFVGRVEARATTTDIVDAAIAADADLRRQAKKLGADVVKIDVIAPPSRSRQRAQPHHPRRPRLQETS